MLRWVVVLLFLVFGFTCGWIWLCSLVFEFGFVFCGWPSFGVVDFLGCAGSILVCVLLVLYLECFVLTGVGVIRILGFG